VGYEEELNFLKSKYKIFMKKGIYVDIDPFFIGIFSRMKEYV